MFARPYAPSERPGGLVSPRKSPSKHAQMFRISATPPVPDTPVLAHTYRPASASPHARTQPTTPVRPHSATMHTPLATTPVFSDPPLAAAAGATPITPRAGGFSTPRAGGLNSPAVATARRANKDYQAAFLFAVDARHRTEADRLTLFNRLAHLRAGVEKAVRAAETTRAQIERVEAARIRHAQESEQRQIVETAHQEARARHARALRSAHSARRDAFLKYKHDMVSLRREQAAAQRDVHAELLAHRATMAAEELHKFKVVRADIQERHHLFHQRAAAARAHELAQAAQQKEWRILLEQQRRLLAEEDLVRMQEEEAELLAHAQRTREEHEQAVEHLASLVLHERTLPTARARYTSIAALQGRISPRKAAKTQTAKRSTPTIPTTPTTPTHHQHPYPPPTPPSGLPLPSHATQQRIHMPHAVVVAPPPAAVASLPTSPAHVASYAQEEKDNTLPFVRTLSDVEASVALDEEPASDAEAKAEEQQEEQEPPADRQPEDEPSAEAAADADDIGDATEDADPRPDTTAA